MLAPQAPAEPKGEVGTGTLEHMLSQKERSVWPLEFTLEHKLNQKGGLFGI